MDYKFIENTRKSINSSFTSNKIVDESSVKKLSIFEEAKQSENNSIEEYLFGGECSKEELGSCQIEPRRSHGSKPKHQFKSIS